MSDDTQDITILRDVMIPLRDGTHLGANVYLPTDGRPVPALVQYTPYLKDGLGGRGIVDVIQRRLARRGYAAVTLDIRGYGASEGVPAPPFAIQEAIDGHDALAWLAAQRWCTGRTGMWGVSWGGNTGLAVAATNPPSLGAIVTIHAIDDEFTGAAWPHGCRGLVVGDMDWGFRCVGLQLLPPLRFTEPDWPDRWRARLDAMEQPFPFTWYAIAPSTWATWRTEIERIRVPTLAVSAFHDSYPLETVEYHDRLQVPRRLLLGPWKHEHPDFAVHSPIGFEAEMARWFDHWLKGIGPAPLEPPVTWCEQPSLTWRSGPTWPPAGSSLVDRFAAPDGRLTADSPTTAETQDYRVDPTVGLSALPWDWTTGTPATPPDISPDDHRALAWTTEPLASALLLEGNPEVVIHLESDQPDVPLRAWLSDVSPYGRSTLISQGWVRPTHLLGGPLRPGEPVELVVPLNPTSYRVAAGNRVRLAVAGSHFPALVPAPANANLRVHCSPARPTRIRLPMVDPARAAAGPAPAFAPAITDRPEGIVNDATYEVRRSLDDTLGAYDLRRRSRGRLEGGGLLTWSLDATVEVARARPGTFAMHATQTWRVEPDGAGTPAQPIELRLTGDETFDRFVITAEADIGGRRIFSRTWEQDLRDAEWHIRS
ncbi:MAG: CocE/NonD family hydrolase [Chloroflexi bacterium]|nr:CocE/NonD family hydrolase [Chloroflexota bacterium]